MSMTPDATRALLDTVIDAVEEHGGSLSGEKRDRIVRAVLAAAAPAPERDDAGGAEEWAREIATVAGGRDEETDRLARRIVAALRAAVAGEREACIVAVDAVPTRLPWGGLTDARGVKADCLAALRAMVEAERALLGPGMTAGSLIETFLHAHIPPHSDALCVREAVFTAWRAIRRPALEHEYTTPACVECTARLAAEGGGGMPT